MTDSGIEFILGSGGAARFYVELKDIACVALSPKRKGAQLKLVSVLCRCPSRRIGMGKKGARELDMICHVFRPVNAATMWDFYIAFEKLLQARNVSDPYLALAQKRISGGLPPADFEKDSDDEDNEDTMSHKSEKTASSVNQSEQRKSTSPVAQDPYLRLIAANKSTTDAPKNPVSQFNPTGIDLLEQAYEDQRNNDDGHFHPFATRIVVKPIKDEADSDIELDCSDSETEQEQLESFA